MTECPGDRVTEGSSESSLNTILGKGFAIFRVKTKEFVENRDIYLNTVKLQNTNNHVRAIVPKRMSQAKKSGHFERSLWCPYTLKISTLTK